MGNPIYTEKELKDELESIIGRTARSIKDAQIRAIFEEALSNYIKH